MAFMDQWPLAATIAWLAFGAWLVVQGRNARKPLADGQGIGPGRAAFRRFLQSRAGRFGGVVFYVMVLGCLFGPWLIFATTGFTYDKTQLGGGVSKLPPPRGAWFGFAARN